MSPFASRSVPEHLGRGACAALLVMLAFWLWSPPPGLRIAAIAAVIVAAVLIRGCPMCWLAGLMETISASNRKGHR